MILIDGKSYNVDVVSLSVKADFLDKYAERTDDGVLQRELIGVYFNYQLKLGASVKDPRSYNALWDKLTEAKEFHTVIVPDDYEDFYTFIAYFSNVQHSMLKQSNGKNYWKGLTVNFIAKEPARS